MRPSRGIELSATTSLYVGAFLRPIRRSRIFSAIVILFPLRWRPARRAWKYPGLLRGRSILLQKSAVRIQDSETARGHGHHDRAQSQTGPSRPVYCLLSTVYCLLSTVYCLLSL